MDLRSRIRTIPDFPEPGVQFRDITTLMSDPCAFAHAVDALAGVETGGVDAVVGIDARGFIFGAAVARALGVGFVPVRKPGKLPGATLAQRYTLEYGESELHLPDGLLGAGDRVYLIDDLIATGGSAIAAAELIRRAGAEVVHAAFVIGLPDLMGQTRLRALDVPVTTLVDFEGG